MGYIEEQITQLIAKDKYFYVTVMNESPRDMLKYVWNLAFFTNKQLGFVSHLCSTLYIIQAVHLRHVHAYACQRTCACQIGISNVNNFHILEILIIAGIIVIHI